MRIIAEVLRRIALVLVVVGVFAQVLVGEMGNMFHTPRPARQLRPKGAEWRVIRPIGPRILAIRLQVIYA